MSSKVKDINIKTEYTTFSIILSICINIKPFNPSNTKIDKKSYLLHWICYNQRYKLCKNQ